MQYKTVGGRDTNALRRSRRWKIFGEEDQHHST
ncbi:unnamed protein product [Larinioides sclopetarius]|uniref:Uncharacterized protein n=1 Tax=Larinioides sclopetarius TaxID=280406 RepID=A0AAV2A841_9ARAC